MHCKQGNRKNEKIKGKHLQHFVIVDWSLVRVNGLDFAYLLLLHICFSNFPEVYTISNSFIFLQKFPLL